MRAAPMTILRFGPVDRADEFQDLLSSVHSMLGGRDQLAMFPINFKLVLERRVWEHERRTANGRIIPPMSIYDLVHLHFPDGLGATFDIVENIIRDHPDIMALWTEVTKRPAGAPKGNKNALRDWQKEALQNLQELQPAIEGHKIEAQLERPSDKTTVNNVNGCVPERPQGNSAAAGLRKLQKAAAAGNDNARAALAEVVAGKKKVHRACIEAGLRKDTSVNSDARRECDRRSAALIVEHIPPENLAALMSDLRSAGHASLAAEVERAAS
jgi:hypothetical protein